MYVTLAKAFDKKFVLAFCNSFLEIELECDKENHAVKYMQLTKADAV